MATLKKRKSKLNGSANAFNKALKDLVKGATEEAVDPVVSLLADIEERLSNRITSTEKNIKSEISTLRENTQVQLRSVNERLGKLESKR